MSFWHQPLRFDVETLTLGYPAPYPDPHPEAEKIIQQILQAARGKGEK